MTLLPNYKDIVELMKKGTTLEAQEKIMELREGALELQEENIKLKEQIAILQKELDDRRSLFFDGSVYWRNAVELLSREGPFCPRCYDADHRLMTLHEEEVTPDSTDWHCRQCSNFYERK